MKVTDVPNNTCIKAFKIDELPDDVLVSILLYLPGKELVKNGLLVCKLWMHLIDTEAFWLNKCLNDNILTRQHANLLHNHQIFASKKLYFLNFFNRNLLKNACAQQEFAHWCSSDGYFSYLQGFRQAAIIRKVDLDENKIKKALTVYKTKYSQLENDAKWRVQDHNGAEEIFDKANNPIKNFVTSHEWASKMQVIELDNDMVELFIKNGLSLKVTVSETYAARFDCGCRYQLMVFLIDDSFKIVDLFEFNDEFPQWSDAKWKTVKHVFDVKQSFRYIIFNHAGNDTQFWAGYYGSKMTNGSVIISV